MPIETATYISELNTALPAATDGLQQADDHMRLLKDTIKATFPNFTAAALSATQADLDNAVAAVKSGTIEVRWKLGTEALPGLTPTGDTNTGFYSPGADQLGASVNGAAGWTLAADKTFAMKGNATVAGTFAATGNSTFGGTLGCTGAATFSSTMAVTGNVTLSGSLTGVAATLSGLLTLSSTSHWIPAKGTTAQRPGTPSAGWSRFNSSLNVPEFYDGGAWRQPSIASPVAGAFKNLVVEVTGNTTVDIDADYLEVETTSGVVYRIPVNVTINGAGAAGPNSLDTGGLGSSDWLSVWVFYNPSTDTAAGVLSLSATAPSTTNLSGYTAKARVGWVRTTSTSVLVRTLQKGRRAVYAVQSSGSSNALPEVAANAVGTWDDTAPTWVAKSVVDYVPTATALSIILQVRNAENSSQTPRILSVAPTVNYGGIFADDFPPFYCGQSNVVAAQIELNLETTSIAVVSGGSGSSVRAYGWEDNI